MVYEGPNNFSFELDGLKFLMVDGELEINGVHWPSADSSEVYVLVRYVAVIEWEKSPDETTSIG